MLGAATLGLISAVDVVRARRQVQARLDALDAPAPAMQPAASCATIPPPGVAGRSGGALASWQTIGGCGAGSSAGIGGIKWIGRNVTGGLVNVQCQGSYTRYGDGYVYALNNQLTVPLGDAFTIGVIVPYLYKWIDDPLQVRIDYSNEGLGDINGLVTWKLGADPGHGRHRWRWACPPAAHEARHGRVHLSPGPPAGRGQGQRLADDRSHLRQPLGAGGDRGGGLVSGRRKRASRTTARPAPPPTGTSATCWAPFVPALGISGTVYQGADRDVGLASDSRSNAMVAANASLEWSTDWLAILAGVSLPYSPRGLEPWTAGLGFAIAPF